MKRLMTRRSRRWLFVPVGCLVLGVVIIGGNGGAATAYRDEALGGMNAHDATVYSHPQTPHVEFISTAGARPGESASAAVQTLPGVSCMIRYVTPLGTATRTGGLKPAVASAEGQVSWSWVIAGHTATGTGTVTVTCAGKSESASIQIFD